MNIPINLLQAFVIVAESNSLAKASELMNMTQPALSMQLKKLEKLFALPIFEFQGKRKVLTPYGQSCYREGKRLINEFNLSFERLNRQYLDGSQLSLRVGGRRELLAKIQKTISFDGIILFEALSSGEAIQALESRRIDVAVSRIKPNSSNIVAKEFITSCPWMVTHKKWVKDRDPHKLSTDKDFLIETPLIIYTDSADLMTDWLAHVDLSLTQLNVKYVCADWLTILQMIESGVGYAVIPDSIESNLSSVINIELPCSVVEAQTYYFLYSKSLTKIPAYREIFKSV